MKISNKATKLLQCAPIKRNSIFCMAIVLVILGFGLAATPAHADAPIFNVAHGLGGLDNTYGLAAGDLDGDGDLDLVVGNSGEPSLVYLNDGKGHFIPGAPLDSSGNTRSLALGDLDNDGDLDLVVGNWNQQNLIYLNDGSGIFSSSVPLGSAGYTSSVALADLNGDGRLDIVVGAGSSSNSAQNLIYLNAGAGAFPTAQPLGAPDPTTSIALGDLDRNGEVDIVVGNDSQPNAVYLNTGGVFSATVPFGASDWTHSLALGDLDGDNDLDLVVGNDGQKNLVYVNDGTGLFSASAPFGNDDDTQGLALGDLDSDGDLDLLVGNEGEQNLVYLNDGSSIFSTGVPFGGQDKTSSVALADWDGDGDLDAVIGNRSQQNLVYLNDGPQAFFSGALFGGAHSTFDLASGDVDSDGDLDLALGNWKQANLVYFNDGNGDLVAGAPFGQADPTASVALGDLDGDSDLDLVVGNDGQPNLVYPNNGSGVFSASVPFGDADNTRSLALGDLDNDGDLDVAVGKREQPNQVYLNDGKGGLSAGLSFGGDDETQSLALGDLDSDGDLDMVEGNFGQPGVVYLNDGSGLAYTAASLDDANQTHDLALGDLDGDGDLDILAGNYSQQHTLYLNKGGLQGGKAGTFAPGRLFGNPGLTFDIALGDWNGDGDLDLFIGNNSDPNEVYSNDGTGTLSLASSISKTEFTYSLATADLNGDGATDMVAGTSLSQKNVLYLNRSGWSTRLPNTPPRVAIIGPGLLANANFAYSDPAVRASIIPISYTLSDPDGEPVRAVRAFYSLDGGGRWYPAVTDSGAITLDISAPGRGLAADGAHAAASTTQIYRWDVFASGFFGQSDSIVFRLEAYPALKPAPNTVSGLYQRPYAAAASLPFRVRGAQVRVYSQTVASGHEASGALVYRLPKGQTLGAEPLGGAQNPFYTDAYGYLQGHSQLETGDRLTALLPVTASASFSLPAGLRSFHTSASVTPAGLNAYTVTHTGMQILSVSAANPLTLLDLDISLEWDARADAAFLSRLQFDLLRTSEILYDWTNGQMALGQINIYHEREHWLEAHIRVYASNRLRPNAVQGGLVSQVISDPLTSTITYAPGQVRMGATWNRYGEPGSNLGEDWPRTLAHELGHYALFLDDNYLGLGANGWLEPVEGCPSAMSDPYRVDFPYDEFHPDSGWLPACQNTLSQQITGRSDWSTIQAFYPWLSHTSSNSGPGALPLALTRFQITAPITPSTALENPVFYLIQAGHRVQPGRNARAFLFRGRWISDLGRPTLDQVLARGARPGDRLCVYDFSLQPALLGGQLGCEPVTPGDEQLELMIRSDWPPEVIVSPVNSRTIAITLTHLPAGLALGAQLFPSSDPAVPPISLTAVMSGYVGTFNTLEPALEGYVHVWVHEAPPRREIVSDYAIGGGPGHVRGDRVSVRGRGTHIRSGQAPAISSDGQVILFGKNLDVEFVSLQAATIIPSPPPWATVVGRAYRLLASQEVQDWSGTSLSFSYLGNEVPPGEEAWLRIYFWDGAAWRQLRSQLDTYTNLVSAPLQGEGLYALMTSLEIPLYGPGWNLVAYPAQTTRPVSQALLSISGAYTTVYGYDSQDPTDPWRVYDVSAPAWVNDLEMLEFGRGYWILASRAITWMMGRGADQAILEAWHSDLAGQMNPPATYYGQVKAGAGFAPAGGMTITAWVNGHLCGQSKTVELGGQALYSIHVFADGPSAAAGCGSPGQAVAFHVGAQAMRPTPAWDNNRLWELALAPTERLYLPLIVKNTTGRDPGQTHRVSLKPRLPLHFEKTPLY